MKHVAVTQEFETPAMLHAFTCAFEVGYQWKKGQHHSQLPKPLLIINYSNCLHNSTLARTAAQPLISCEYV
jgi:hypothetical protein